MIKVLIVDDSPFMRTLLTDVLTAADDIEVVGAAADAHQGLDFLARNRPDVITLDVTMPGYDGLQLLRTIMSTQPTPAIMISARTQEGAEISLTALEAGAVDVIGKPIIKNNADWPVFTDQVVAKVRAAHGANLRPARGRRAASPLRSGARGRSKLVALAASTGGVYALSQIIHDWPENGPPVVITQHIPAGFCQAFAKRLNGSASVNVAIVEQRQSLRPGSIWIAPGDRHLVVRRIDGQLVCDIDESGPVNGHKSSANTMFGSVAVAAGSQAVGAILTGMGSDGALGLKAMRDAGAETFAQDEKSCLIYGMPKAALSLDAVDRELPLDEMSAALLTAARPQRSPLPDQPNRAKRTAMTG